VARPSAEEDAQHRKTAQRIEQLFPQWLVMWSLYREEYWACPCFDAPPGTVVRARDVNQLTRDMYAVQAAVRYRQ
jgi:hypothetical protein